MASGRAVPRTCDRGCAVSSLLRTEHRNKDVSPFSWKGLGIAGFCVPDSILSRKTQHTDTPEATEWVRGITCTFCHSLLTCIQLLLWKKRLRAVSLLPGPRERHLCHSHTSITCLPFTPKPPEQVPAFPENPLAKAKPHRQGLNEVFFKGDIFNHCTYLLIFQIKTFKYLRNEGC